MSEHDNLSCQWLIGHEVRSRAGEPLGRIVDLRVEPGYGLIAYAELHIQTKHDAARRCAIPFGLLQFNADDDQITLDMHPQTLANTYVNDAEK